MGLCVSQENRTFLIQKCRFIHCNSEKSHPWASYFYAIKALNVIFDECIVLDGSGSNFIVFDKYLNNSKTPNIFKSLKKSKYYRIFIIYACCNKKLILAL